MDNKNLPAYPVNYIKYYDDSVGNSHEDGLGGLTKREEFAARFFAAMLSNPNMMDVESWNSDYINLRVEMATTAAELLLLHLEKTQK